jgi:voltage-gated potassium channel Kch
MRRNSWSDRLRYAFDNTLSRGPGAMIGWLALVSAVLILAISLIVWAAGFAPGLSFAEVAWRSMLRTLDAGTMGGDTGGWPFLISMLMVTFGGIFLISTLIGILTSGLEGRLEDLRKGRSRVIEKNHTVVLGWSGQVFCIVSELVIANKNQSRSGIVLLAEKDKVAMQDEIRDKVGPTGRTRIVCRRGSPIDMADLDLVSLATSKSIIILSPDSRDPDSEVIKTLLAVTNNPDRRPEPYHIVAEIRDPRNLEVAQLIGGNEVELVLVDALVSRTIAQTCRQSGLSVVHTELLDFAGDEIYFQEEPALVGETFADALLAYEDSAVIGLQPRAGTPKLNPPMEAVIQPGDQVIAISEDDDTVILSGRAELGIRPDAIRLASRPASQPERTLILGWNGRTPAVINELDHYVAPGSSVDVVAGFPEGAAEIARCCADLKKQTVQFSMGDTTDRHQLDGMDLGKYDHVVVLASTEALDDQRADARTLVTLLHLRDIADRHGYRFSIVSEILDVRNRNLAAVTRADDFVVSDELASLMLAQVSENKALNAVFADIFDPEGSEIYLKPAGEYVALGEALNFYTIVASARRRGEVAIGYRIARHARDAAADYGVVVNPDKSDLVTLAEGDRIIVVAED